MLGRSVGALMRGRRGVAGGFLGRTSEWISARGGSSVLRLRAAFASSSDDGAPPGGQGSHLPKHIKCRSLPAGASKFSAPFDDGGSSVSDHDNQWFGGGVGGSSVSDADNWGSQSDGSRFKNPVVQHEQRMFEGLRKMGADPDKMKWPTRHMILPMGQQRKKNLAEPQPGTAGLDEVWGRKGAIETQLPRPARIILVRHGESQGNSDEGVYGRVSDWRISLTDRGRAQASKAAEYVKEAVGDKEVFFYYSPYSRAVETCQIMLETFDPSKVRGIREDPRMAEQQFGNLQDSEAMKKIKNERHLYGRFFYRFPSGEAGMDVYSRVTSFIATIKRDHVEEGCNIVIVTHGLALRLFLMAWFRWTVEQFESTTNPPNCGVAVLERVDGTYRMTDHTCRMIGCENDGPTSPCVARGLWETQGMPERQDMVGNKDRQVNVAALHDVKKAKE